MAKRSQKETAKLHRAQDTLNSREDKLVIRKHVAKFRYFPSNYNIQLRCMKIYDCMHATMLCAPEMLRGNRYGWSGAHLFIAFAANCKALSERQRNYDCALFTIITCFMLHIGEIKKVATHKHTTFFYTSLYI